MPDSNHANPFVNLTTLVIAAISDTTGHLLLTPSKVLRHGKTIEPVNREEIGDLAARIKEVSHLGALYPLHCILIDSFRDSS